MITTLAIVVLAGLVAWLSWQMRTIESRVMAEVTRDDAERNAILDDYQRELHRLALSMRRSA